MMKKTVILTFKAHQRCKLTLVYRNGKLEEIKNIQSIKSEIWDWIPKIVPFHENLIEKNKAQFANKLVYTEVTAKLSKHHQFLVEWFYFYENKTGIKPRHSGTEGKALNGIIKYLEDLSSSQDEALAVWQSILLRWSELDTFTQSKCELMYINSKINLILQQLKVATNEDRKI